MSQKLEFDTIFYVISDYTIICGIPQKNEIYTFLLYDECNTAGFSYIISLL